MAEVRSHTVYNRWVVPYDTWLCKRYNAHINVESCTTVKSVKYIYIYIYKDHNALTIVFGDDKRTNYDEVNAFLNVRYVGSVEAVWHIFEFPIHKQSCKVEKLDCHLENHQ